MRRTSNTLTNGANSSVELSLADERRIDAVCDAFEQSLNAAQSESIESIVDREPLKLQRFVLQELLRVEFAAAKFNGFIPDLDAYYHRFESGAKDIVDAAYASVFDSDTLHMASESLFRTPVIAGQDAARIENELPRQFGKFQLREELGAGGMGIVYRAFDTELQRDVALKMIRGSFLTSAAAVERFRGEAIVSARLNHPGLVPIYDVHTEQGQRYITMPLVNGVDLGSMLRDQPQNPAVAANIAHQCALAIQHAHEAHVIHRDLKPANILVTADGLAQITDFGLAKFLDAESDLTITGDVVGTPSYMSPEQARGMNDKIDIRTDIYSLGAVFYHQLTGRPPFKSESRSTTIRQVIDDDPVRPRLLDPTIPKDLETICLKCLAKKPPQRYQSSRELADDLGRYLSGRPITARPVSKIERGIRWSLRNPVASVMCLFGLAVVLGGIFLTATLQNHAAQRVILVERQRSADAIASAEATKRQAAEELLSTTRYYHLVNDIRVLAASRRVGWKSTALAILDELRTLGVDVDDKASIRTVIAQVCCAFDIGNGRNVAAGFYPFSVVYSPNGKYLAMGKHGAPFQCPLRIYTSDDFELFKEFVVTSPAEERFSGLRAICFDRDSLVLFAATRNGVIHRWDIESGAHKYVETDDGFIRNIVISADNKLLATVSESRSVRVWEPTELIELAQVSNLGQRIIFGPQADQLSVGSEHLTIFDTSNVNTGLLKQVSDRPGFHVPLTYSSDLRLIAFGDDVTARVRGVGRTWGIGMVDDQLESESHLENLTTIEFSTDNSLLLTGSGDQSYKFWDIATGDLVVAKRVNGDSNLHGSFRPDKQQIAMVEGHDVNVYDLMYGSALTTLAIHATPITAFDFSDDGNRIICETPDRFRTGRRYVDVAVWDLANNRQIAAKRFLLHPNEARANAYAATFSTDQESAILVHPGFVRVWHWRDDHVAETEMRLERYGRVASDARGSMFWVANSDRLSRFDFEGEKLVETWAFENSVSREELGYACITGISQHADRLYIASLDGMLRRFSKHPNCELDSTWVIGGHIVASAISHDGTMFACGLHDGTLHVQNTDDIKEGPLIRRFMAHDDAVTSIAFHPHDAQLVVTGGEDGWIHFWQLSADKPTKIMSLASPARRSPVLQIAFSPVRNHLAAIFRNEGAVRNWDLDAIYEQLGRYGLHPFQADKASEN